MEYKINNGTNSDRCKPRLKIRYVTGKRNNAASMHDRWLQFGISDMDIDTSDLTRPDVYRSSHDWVGSSDAGAISASTDISFLTDVGPLQKNRAGICFPNYGLSYLTLIWNGRLGSRVVSVLDSGAEGPGSNRSRDAVG